MARSLETIRKQIAALEAEARKAERASQRGIDAVLRMMDRHGVTIDDLRGVGKGRSRGASKLASKPVQPKYRDPKTGETWSGRGRAAAWLAAAEKAGKKRESFLIK